MSNQDIQSSKIDKLQDEMNEYVPKDFVKSTLDKLADSPDRLLGVLHANSFQMGSLVSFGYSRNNSYGNAIESVFSSIIEDNGWTIEDTKYKFEDYNLPSSLKRRSDQKSIAIDQVFSNKDYYVFIEQKIRDDHDTSKKTGQWANYEQKFRVLNEIIQDKKVIGIMWMIDDGFNRNKDFYSNDEHMGKMNTEFPGQNFLIYGKDIDQLLNSLNSDNKPYFDVFDAFLKEWHSNAPKIPELDFDKFPYQVCNALDSMSEKDITNLFSNKQIITEAFPILFPNLEAIKCYRKQLIERNSENEKDKNIIELINKITS